MSNPTESTSTGPQPEGPWLRLHNWIQTLGPRYKLTSYEWRLGPDHSPTWHSVCISPFHFSPRFFFRFSRLAHSQRKGLWLGQGPKTHVRKRRSCRREHPSGCSCEQPSRCLRGSDAHRPTQNTATTTFLISSLTIQLLQLPFPSSSVAPQRIDPSCSLKHQRTASIAARTAALFAAQFVSVYMTILRVQHLFCPLLFIPYRG